MLGLALGARLENSLGAAGKDADGTVHAGINPHPVPALSATGEELRRIKALADQRDLTVVGFNEVARSSCTYVEYLDRLAVTEPQELEYVGLALFGPRQDVNKLTGKLSLAT
ncbi:hypothetical protein GCM10007079_19290 [Nocardiopsis terrae]|uniref:DUF2000 domain-containing protein n=1 Tax=Nocardiopsis terrae TaxID=372655 RepID=A0ABR9HHE3_9ACTN|nr:DUF2000 domain-containing protein [Nocardiopsis terrae]MBE1458452.1 hypothetical protein [Nocardiopsis terrae]GHC80380.1 hypothetical protein GCM10007079_19290 [Nocardiopsis terrae]